MAEKKVFVDPSKIAGELQRISGATLIVEKQQGGTSHNSQQDADWVRGLQVDGVIRAADGAAMEAARETIDQTIKQVNAAGLSPVAGEKVMDFHVSGDKQSEAQKDFTLHVMPSAHDKTLAFLKTLPSKPGPDISGATGTQVTSPDKGPQK